MKPQIMKKKNIICFAYGQSGAGKTYTLLGNDGIIYKHVKKY